MTVLDSIKATARTQLGELSEAQLREQYRKLLTRAKDRLPQQQGAESDGVAMMAQQALKKLEEREDRFGKLGELGIVALVAELASGDEQAALSIFLATRAGWDDLLGAVAGARETDLAAKHKREALKAEALAWIKDVGSAAAKAALPFLLKVVLGGLTGGLAV
jgi:hypothetical protein